MTQDAITSVSTPSLPSKFEWTLATAVWGLTIVGGVACAVGWWAFSQSIEHGAGYTMLLLLSSSVLLMMGFPHRAQAPWWLVFIYAALESWKILLLLAYAHVGSRKETADALSLAAVFFACGILIGLLWLASWVTRQPERYSFIRTHFFPTICAALFLFAHVAYDLTFALALHDGHGDHQALYATPRLTDSKKYTVHFSEGNPMMNELVQLSPALEPWPADSNEQTAAVQSLQKVNAATAREIAFNVSQWKEILAEIDGDRTSKWWRVTIIGHASDAIAATDGKQRNLSLSEQRAEETWKALRQALKKDRPEVSVEWTLLGRSNDDRFVNENFLDGKDHKLSVEILLEKERKFELLDYAYFMIYTITTTGYGDLMPTTPQAKFITCLANIFELLFFMIVINLMFGLYNDHKPVAPKPT